MTKIESKIGKISNSDKRIFNYLSNFNNLENIIPRDKVTNWKSTEDSCHFSMSGIGDLGMRIIEKEANKLIKITGDSQVPLKFFFWIQLKQVAENDTRIKLTIKADLDPMMKIMSIKSMEKFVNMLVDELEKFPF